MMVQMAYGGASGGSISGKMILAAGALFMAGPVLAEVVSCQMSDGEALEFAIDHNQFVNAVDPNDPPRRKVTFVQYGPRDFPAEPILMGQTRGFHAEGLGGSTIMFVMQDNGAAVLTNRQQGLRVEGFCEVMN